MNNKKNGACSLIIFATIICLLTSCGFVTRPRNEYACEIGFDNYADGYNINNSSISFKDERALREHIDSLSGQIFYNPKLADYSVVERFGFDPNNYVMSEFVKGERVYLIDGEDGKRLASLYIDEFGCFTYSSENRIIAEKDYPYSERETMEMGKAYLKEKGLWPEGQVSDAGRGITEESYDPKTGETRVGSRGIKFYPKISVVGNYRIQVNFNQNGEVTTLHYNWREYESVADADLINLDEAIERIKQGKAQFEYEAETISNTIEIQKVDLSYWSSNRDVNSTVMQPVYIFTCQDSNGELIYITVQANRV